MRLSGAIRGPVTTAPGPHMLTCHETREKRERREERRGKRRRALIRAETGA